jgi:FHS family L-fucose permease-like MFS transporter
MKKDKSIYKVLPVLFGFFIMGFVDVVGISTNYVKQDFGLSDTVANLLPLMLFLWFAVLSVPTGLMMNKLGRKNTVLISMGITLLAMLVPLISYNFPMILITFSLLGIGNTIIQVAMNPLVSNVVSKNRLTSSLTLGQFLGPIIAAASAVSLGNWKFIFPIFAAITVISGLWLILTSIHEEQVSNPTSSFSGCFNLLKDRTILMFFLGIIFAVGLDVGFNTTIPKFLIERCNIPLEKAGLGISLYFVARTIGTLLGAIILIKLDGRIFFIVNMLLAIPVMILMLLTGNLFVILATVFLLGLLVANIFSIIFSAALKKEPKRANEIAGLLVMGIAGGAVLPLLMGLVSDSLGQTAGMALLLAAFFYLLFNAFKMEKS